jgi:hypothetical protein
MKGRRDLEDLGVDVKKILDWDLREVGWEGVDWMNHPTGVFDSGLGTKILYEFAISPMRATCPHHLPL